MIFYDYKCGMYDVETLHKIETVPYFGADDDKGWFRVNSGKIKGDSTHVRMVQHRGTLVRHRNKIDWDATFFFMAHDIHQQIISKFKSK